MKRVLSAAAGRVTVIATIVAAVAWATNPAAGNKKEIVALTANEVRWFTPPYYHDGRQRAHLFGDSSQGGTWNDRVFPRSRNYGTSMIVLALLGDKTPLPPKWEKK